MKNLSFLLMLLSLASCRQQTNFDQLQSSTWIDLTHEFDGSTVYWPTDENFRHDTIYCGMTDKGYFYASFKYSAEEHGGTHLDSPLHFHQGGKSTDMVSVDRLHGPGVVVDVTHSSGENRDYLIGVSDFEKWEKENGKIPEGSIILLNTGFGKFWNDHLKYTGTLKKGKEGVDELHFPGLDPSAAKWLTSKRSIKAIGIDTPSIDYGQSKDFQTHQVLCAAGLTIYENVANLDLLPLKGTYIIALPMKIKGGSGTPLRIVAILK